jgi:hypothetical protein
MSDRGEGRFNWVAGADTLPMLGGEAPSPRLCAMANAFAWAFLQMSTSLLPEIMLGHLQISPQNIDRFPAPCPHDGGRVIPSTEQILRRTNAAFAADFTKRFTVVVLRSRLTALPR